MTPWAITLLNAASTLGETSFPYLIGLAFERKQRAALGKLMLFAQLGALAVAVLARRGAARFAQREARRAATTWSGEFGD